MANFGNMVRRAATVGAKAMRGDYSVGVYSDKNGKNKHIEIDDAALNKNMPKKQIGMSAGQKAFNSKAKGK